MAVDIDISILDTLSSIGATYYMRESLLRVRFKLYNNGFIFLLFIIFYIYRNLK